MKLQENERQRKPLGGKFCNCCFQNLALKKMGELNYLPFLNDDDDRRELKHQTFLSIWTSNSRGETESISAYVA